MTTQPGEVTTHALQTGAPKSIQPPTAGPASTKSTTGYGRADGRRAPHLCVAAVDAVAVVVHAGGVGGRLAAGVNGCVAVVTVAATEVRPAEAAVQEAMRATGGEVVAITVCRDPGNTGGGGAQPTHQPPSTTHNPRPATTHPATLTYITTHTQPSHPCSTNSRTPPLPHPRPHPLPLPHPNPATPIISTRTRTHAAPHTTPHHTTPRPHHLHPATGATHPAGAGGCQTHGG